MKSLHWFSRLLAWPVSCPVAVAIVILAALPAIAEGVGDVTPTVGLRENAPTDVLLKGAVLVTDPEFYRDTRAGEPPSGDVLIRHGVIVAVGESILPPPGCRTIDCAGKMLYAGWINAWHEVSSDHVTTAQDSDDYWNANIVVGRRIGDLSEVPDAGKLRSQGFTTTVLAPPGRILGGQASVWSLNQAQDGHRGCRRVGDPAWMTAAMSVPRPNDANESYPNSPMGSVALLRQAIYDARWYGDAEAAQLANRSLPSPHPSETLGQLNRATRRSSFVFDCPNERMVLRADGIANEFALRMIVRGSGREYRDADRIVATNRVLLLPLDFPEQPNVSTRADAREVDLETLMHWKLAATNPAEMIRRGATVCLTTDRLNDPSKFLSQLRTAVQRGLSRRDAIAALTTTPARTLGLEQTHGRIAVGMSADLVLTNGDLFDKTNKLLRVFVAGQDFEINTDPDDELKSIVGSWQLQLAQDSPGSAQLVIKQKEGRISAELTAATSSATDQKTDPKQETSKPSKIELKKIVQRRDQFSGQITCAASAEDSDVCASLGIGRGTQRVVVRSLAKTLAQSSAEQPLTIEIDQVGQPVRRFQSVRVQPDAGEQKQSDAKPSEEAEATGLADATAGENEASDLAVVYPLGAYGRVSAVPQPDRILFRGALVWTCEDRNDLRVPDAPMDVLVEHGRIAAIGEQLKIDPNVPHTIVDARGKHLTPGIIDCHSHAGTDGGVNESGQAITAEVRIADFINPSDITLYRQLAGGVTTINILHGSANPIGGQNQVIKLRWGDSGDEMKFADAPAGIKFALGENVKRATSRYPNTRMGVEQLLRDQFLAARQYAIAHRRWDAGQRDSMPPRVDLQLQAMAEIQAGTRWIHCHSYRQDEIIATLDVLEEFGIQIGSLQHVLEGYKVADRLAEHGAMASAFADWWAYKPEAYDAIPFNGVLMHKAGVVVSYNSDDPELGRHLNTEAAKAVKYGGLSPTEALKFVTLNPAKQLRIENHVGSIEVGKDADLVLWSGPPLSTTTRCEQTWVDGRPMFDLKDDAALRQRDDAWRNRLIQELLDGKPKTSEAPEKVDEEDRWLNYDEFCNTRGGQQTATSQRSGESR